MTLRIRRIGTVALALALVLGLGGTARAGEGDDEEPGPDEPAPESDEAAESRPAPAPRPRLAPPLPPPPPPDPGVAILINPLQPLLGLVLGMVLVPPEVQLRFTKHLGLSVVPMFTYLFDRPAGIEVYGGGLGVGLRVFPLGTGLRGLYLVPRFDLVYAVGRSSSSEVTSTAFSATVEVGYSWIWGILVMNVGGGGGYRAALAGDIVLSGIQHLQLVVNGSIGIAP